MIYLAFSTAEMSAVRYGRRDILDLNWCMRDDKRKLFHVNLYKGETNQYKCSCHEYYMNIRSSGSI